MPAALPATSMRVNWIAGAAARIVQKSRAFGSAASLSSPKLVADVVDVTSTTGDAPLTVTVSCSDATFMSVVDRRGEAEADVDALAHDGAEAR